MRITNNLLPQRLLRDMHLQGLDTQLGTGSPEAVELTATPINSAFNRAQTLLATNDVRVRPRAAR